MANIRKSFNFRNGVQVDNDNFVVNANGLVGIGTSVPTEAIDAVGNAKISGLTTTGTLGVAQTATFFDDVKVGSVVNIDPTSGVITATKFVGDASGLTNIVAISTVGWISEGVGLHTISKSVGIGTTDPLYALQIGQDPASGTGIGMTAGNILVSGIVTASTFSGNVNAGPTGVVTAPTFEGDLTGVASTATKLENARDFAITGDLVASAVSFDGTSNVSLASTLSSSFSADTTGIITATKFVGVVTATEAGITTATITNANLTNADVGIGTFDDLRIDKAAGASLVVTSTTNSSVSIGESVGAGNSSAQLLYTPGTGRLDINNYDVGGVSINLHEGTGTGTTESFNVKYDNTKQFEVTYDGKVGINRGGVSLTRNFEVGGDAFVSQNAVISGILTVNQGGVNEVTLGDGSALPMPDSQNFNTVSGISTFNNLNVANNLSVGASITAGTVAYFGSEVGIGTTNNSVFLSGPTNLKAHIEGSTWSKNGFYTAGRLIVTTKADGSEHTDDRVIPSGNGALGPSDTFDFGAVVPFVDYGDFQMEGGGASLIGNNLLIVPSIGVPTVGFGTTNGALIPSSFQSGGNKYLTNVGINTYYARSIFDVGTASTTMNSYFIPPSLTQSEINIMQSLWETPTGTGHVQSKKVTPTGLVPGAIIHNKTTDQIQVRASANTFRNINSQYTSTQTITNGDSTVTFNDVPAWANKITILFLNIQAGAGVGVGRHFKVQLGTSSSFITSNYDSESVATSSTPGAVNIGDGFVIHGNSNVATFSGHQTIIKFDDTAYVETHILSPGSTSTGIDGISHGGGNLESISGTITRLKIEMNDGSTFGGGKVRVIYDA